MFLNLNLPGDVWFNHQNVSRQWRLRSFGSQFLISGYVLQGATEADAWSNLAVVAGASELLRSDLPRPSFARWVRVMIQGSGDLRLWEFQVRGWLLQNGNTPEIPVLIGKISS